MSTFRGKNSKNLVAKKKRGRRRERGSIAPLLRQVVQRGGNLDGAKKRRLKREGKEKGKRSFPSQWCNAIGSGRHFSSFRKRSSFPVGFWSSCLCFFCLCAFVAVSCSDTKRGRGKSKAAPFSSSSSFTNKTFLFPLFSPRDNPKMG